jgi:hypothetical protein
MFEFRSPDRQREESGALGWRRPSWPGLFVVAAIGAALGMLPVISSGLLTYMAVPLLLTGVCGAWYAQFRQQALEGALWVTAAMTIGQVAGDGFAMLGKDWAITLSVSTFVFWIALKVLLGLSLAPLIVAQSRRRVRAR